MENKGKIKNEDVGGDNLTEMLNAAINKLTEVRGNIDKVTTESLTYVLDILSEIKARMTGDEDMEDAEEYEEEDDEGDDMMNHGGGNSGAPLTISLIVRKAKKGSTLSAALFLMLLSFAVNVQATMKVRAGGVPFPPEPSIFMSDSVYRSSVTCSGDTSMKIDTHTAIVSHITSTGGAVGAWYQIWDARESTASATNAYPVTIKHPSNTYSTINFKTGVSSGLFIIQDRNGGPAPCYEVWHMQR